MTHTGPPLTLVLGADRLRRLIAGEDIPWLPAVSSVCWRVVAWPGRDPRITVRAETDDSSLGPLLDAIRLASDPAQPPTVYRPAREAAYRLTRQAARDAIAAQWRADLEASAALVRRRPHDARPDDGLYDGTHRWTGD